jgi:hypothetical protein
VRVGDFYRANAELMEHGRVRTLEFESGRETERKYTRAKAKVIDMIFFTAGAAAPALPERAPNPASPGRFLRPDIEPGHLG